MNFATGITLDLTGWVEGDDVILRGTAAVRELDGVLWVNDSKATNIASTRVALACETTLGGELGLAGGFLRMDTAPGEGCRIHAELPWRPAGDGPSAPAGGEAR